mmetsp:Transcript_284/g.517  ORF Transcript_284/g.517 Transcript_284/m.517 type:complete len:205 (+) Transcript_284:214-828(+)
MQAKTKTLRTTSRRRTRKRIVVCREQGRDRDLVLCPRRTTTRTTTRRTTRRMTRTRMAFGRSERQTSSVPQSEALQLRVDARRAPLRWAPASRPWRPTREAARQAPPSLSFGLPPLGCWAPEAAATQTKKRNQFHHPSFHPLACNECHHLLLLRVPLTTAHESWRRLPWAQWALVAPTPHASVRGGVPKGVCRRSRAPSRYRHC